MNYTYTASLGEPPRADCMACCGPVDRVHLVVTKHPRGETGVFCEACALSACASITSMRVIELAVTMQKTFPELSAWMARLGVWEIPTTHEDLARAIGVPLGFPRGIWGDA